MKIQAIFCLLALIISCEISAANDDITVSDAWVREAPPGAAMLAAYMTITNTGNRTRVLEWVESMNFSPVMLHRSAVVNGMATMLHQDSLSIPAHGKIELKPGSFHLMMPAPSIPMRAGNAAYFILHFRNGDCLMIETSVKKASDMP
ncbi:MAG: copper chaperone PCu(A)C [Gammaproteobacteria bacterium]